MLRSLILVPALTIGLTVPAVAQQQLPKEGNYEYTSCGVSTVTAIDFSKSHSAASWEAIGTNRSNAPGGFLDMTTFRCLGSGVTIDGKFSGIDFCQAVDKDGDKILTKFAMEGPKATGETLAGTGKYEGIVKTTEGESLGQFPTAKPGTAEFCVRNTGTYKLRSEASGSTTPPAATPSK
jgi:hypothetical protein